MEIRNYPQFIPTGAEEVIGTPSAGSLFLAAASFGGKEFLGTKNGEGTYSPMQSAFFGQNISIAKAAPGATVLSFFGIPVGTVLGTATARALSAGAPSSRLAATPRVGYVGAATAGVLSGWRSGVGTYFTPATNNPNGKTFVQIRFALPALIASSRIFVGFGPTAAPTNVDPNTVNNCIGVGKLTASTNLAIISRSGTTTTTVDLGSNFTWTNFGSSVQGLLEVTIWFNFITALWHVTLKNLDLNVTATEIIPAASAPTLNTMMGITTWICNNATATSNAIDISRIYSETFA